MQIVIDLDERIYNICKGAYKKGCKDKDTGVLAKAIGEGTILPDNHGRLIDADELLINERPSGMSMIQWEDTHFYKAISDAPTVVESTKGEY